MIPYFPFQILIQHIQIIKIHLFSSRGKTKFKFVLHCNYSIIAQ